MSTTSLAPRSKAPPSGTAILPLSRCLPTTPPFVSLSSPLLAEVNVPQTPKRHTAYAPTDTLWASGYEIYDRLSEPYQKFLETLTVTFEQPGFGKVAEKAGFKLYDKPRGAIENVGTELKAVHPVVRTNPVTGWKSIFPVGGHVKHINGVTDEESAKLLSWFLDLVYKNHDLQVRLKWQNPNDIGKLVSILLGENMTDMDSYLG